METTDQPQDDLFKDLGLPLYKSRRWLRFMSVASVFAGLSTAVGNLLIGFAKYGILAIVGILVGLWTAWIGVILWRAASGLVNAHQIGTKEALLHGLERLQTLIRLVGMTLLAYVVAVPLLGVLLAFTMRPVSLVR